MKWKAEFIEHRKQNRIAIYFENTTELNTRIKQLYDAKWSNTLKAWHLPDTEENRIRFKLTQTTKQATPNPTVAKSEEIKLPPNYPVWLADFVRLLKVKNYSPSTIRTYRNAIILFYQYYKDVHFEMLSQKDIERYLLFLIEEKKYSASAINTTVNAIKFLMEKIFKRPKSIYDLPRPKKPLQLPKVMNEKEVIGVLNALDNIKHKAILYLAYSAGLRVSEVINLKIADIDSSRMTLHLQAAKGKKDRIVTLGKVALENLRLYYKKYKPKVYLFEGATGEQYSMRSAQAIFNQAKTKAGIKKEITFHSLRHSYATHLLENGTDIRFIKELLGHNDIKTTVRYTHVSKKSIEQIESPLDKLMRNNF
ncbi:MAG: hypothetical protein RI955_677 [Bacteroidota bacterium]